MKIGANFWSSFSGGASERELSLSDSMFGATLLFLLGRKKSKPEVEVGACTKFEVERLTLCD